MANSASTATAEAKAVAVIVSRNLKGLSIITRFVNPAAIDIGIVHEPAVVRNEYLVATSKVCLSLHYSQRQHLGAFSRMTRRWREVMQSQCRSALTLAVPASMAGS